MAEDTFNIPLVAAPEEPLSAREVRLERGAFILRLGAIANGIVAALVVLAALAAGLQIVPGLVGGLHRFLLFNYRGADDTALAITILLTLLNMSVFLVLMVGVLARELWALPAIWLLVLVNVAALAVVGFTPALVSIIAAACAGVVVSRDVKAFRVNPVMLKELRGRMRGMRAFVVMTVYLGLMSGFATLLYFLYTSTASRISASSAAGEIGRVLFMGIVGIELMLIIFIAPAFTAGAITGERERQTYDLLKTTLLASPSFVIGKLESALGYILLLLLAAIPLQSIAFLFGGVSEAELILSFIILAVSAVALGTVGIYFSAVMQRTLTASVRAYTVTLIVTFGVPLVLGVALGIITSALYGYGANTSNSPVLEAILTYLQLLVTSMNPVSTALTTQELLISRQVVGFWTETLSNGSTIPMVSPWISFTILYLTASAILVVLTIRSTRKIEA
jgi:ABC-2 type transport system permease protein